MRTSRSLARVLVGLVALSAVAGAIGGTSSWFKPPVPPIIAVIDLEKVVQGLNERGDREKALKDKFSDLQKNLTAKGDKIKDDKSKIELMPAGAARNAAVAALDRLVYEAEFEKQYSQRQYDRLEGEVLRELYAKIVDAAKQLAKQNAYTVVLASDENAVIPSGNGAEVSRAISLKRMLYIDTAHDITNELITFMNNQFAAGAPAPPPAK